MEVITTTGWRLHWRCDAFPDGIPIRIWKNEVDHRHEVEGDHGIRFEAENAEAEADAMYIFGA